MQVCDMHAMIVILALQAAPPSPAIQSILDGNRMSYEARDEMAAKIAHDLSRVQASPCAALDLAFADLNDLDNKLAIATVLQDVMREDAGPQEPLVRANADRISGANRDLAEARGRLLYAYTVLCEWNRPAS